MNREFSQTPTDAAIPKIEHPSSVHREVTAPASIVSRFPPALVVGGMHRSGTSLTASIFAATGIRLGDDLMGAYKGNRRGHFEDMEFYRLHQQILAASGLSREGYTCQDVIDIPEAKRAEAIALVERRRAAGRPWGWKEPRTILFLDFWADLLPEARWLFVVRPPENVCDSLFRRGDRAFIDNPTHAVDVWIAYSRRILAFVRRYPDRSAVIDLARLVTDPASVVHRVSELLGIELTPPESTYEPGLLTLDTVSHRAAFVQAARPEAYDLYVSLLREAGADADADAIAARASPRMNDLAEAAIAEWAAFSRIGKPSG